MPYPNGTKVRLTKDAIENYGEAWAGIELTVIGYADHYVDSKTYNANPAAHSNGHPGYDTALSPMPLYDVDGFNGSLYAWEIKRA